MNVRRLFATMAVAVAGALVLSLWGAVAAGAGRTGAGFKIVRTWHQSFRTADAYRFAFTFQIGPVGHLAQVPLLPGYTRSSLRSACSIDPQTDAIVPAELTLRNLTRGFSMTLSADIDQVASIKDVIHSYRDWIWGVVAYSTGPSCQEIGGVYQPPTLSVSWPNVAPNHSVGPAYEYFVIPGYFSPRYPRGDPDIADRAAVGIVSLNGNAQGAGPFCLLRKLCSPHL